MINWKEYSLIKTATDRIQCICCCRRPGWLRSNTHYWFTIRRQGISSRCVRILCQLPCLPSNVTSHYFHWEKVPSFHYLCTQDRKRRCCESAWWRIFLSEFGHLSRFYPMPHKWRLRYRNKWRQKDHVFMLPKMIQPKKSFRIHKCILEIQFKMSIGEVSSDIYTPNMNILISKSTIDMTGMQPLQI